MKFNNLIILILSFVYITIIFTRKSKSTRNNNKILSRKLSKVQIVGNNYNNLYSNPETLKKGNQFCKEYCSPNLTKAKTCLENRVINCNICDTKLPFNDPKFLQSRSVCKTFCNNHENTCKFYEFRLVVKKKKINSEFLKALNLSDVIHKNILIN